MEMDVLAFFAHPDDETMLCGGTLALLARQGARVHLLIATRGEGGEMGEPALCAREELGRVRENELHCAAKALGAASLEIMDYCDPLVGPEDALFAFTDDVDKLAAQVVEAARRHNPVAILAHGVNGEYGHPAHVLVHDATRLAVHALQDDAPLFYTVQGIFPGHPHARLANNDTPAHMIIDVALVLEQKTAAAMCHRTQHALFVRRGSEEAGRALTVPEVIQAVESLHRVQPQASTDGMIHDALANLLWESGFASLPPAGQP
jgi:LmbE family N-acetylglucosaminyl deacetylase